MREIIDKASRGSLYETDEHAWLVQQVNALKEGRFQDLDAPNLLDFLSEMTRNQQTRLESAFIELLEHMLKIRMQPTRVTRSWVVSIVKQQNVIRLLLKREPNLSHHCDDLFAEAYPAAVRQAAAESGISVDRFPSDCPWTCDEAINYQPPFDNSQEDTAKGKPKINWTALELTAVIAALFPTKSTP